MPWEKQFNVDDALAKAGETFWAKGYEATSLRDLLDAMGIQKGSFYDTYDSKHAAYLRSLEQYAEARMDDFRQRSAALGPTDALRKLFDWIYEDCIGPTGYRGCMVINCALELAHADPQARVIVKQAITAQERLMADLIQSGQRRGEIDDSVDPFATATIMMSFVMGMRVYSRSGGDPSAVRLLADQAIGLVT